MWYLLVIIYIYKFFQLLRIYHNLEELYFLYLIKLIGLVLSLTFDLGCLWELEKQVYLSRGLSPPDPLGLNQCHQLPA